MVGSPWLSRARATAQLVLLGSAVSGATPATRKKAKEDVSLVRPQPPATYQLTLTDKVFCIGPNKAGTMTLQQLFSQFPGDFEPCHDVCNDTLGSPKSWSEASIAHDYNGPWVNHRAFMDNGDNADYMWLDQTFPDSRFVMNLRKLSDWIISRFDQVREEREKWGCSPQGTFDDCPHASWGDNSDENLLGWVMYESNRQAEMIDYFGDPKYPRRRDRFVMIDVPDGDSSETLHRLHWVAREEISTWTSLDLVTLDVPLPAGAISDDGVDGPDQVPAIYSRAHTPYSEGLVKGLLAKAGCTDEQMDARIYLDCSESIKRFVFRPDTSSVVGELERSLALNVSVVSANTSASTLSKSGADLPFWKRNATSGTWRNASGAWKNATVASSRVPSTKNATNSMEKPSTTTANPIGTTRSKASTSDSGTGLDTSAGTGTRTRIRTRSGSRPAATVASADGQPMRAMAATHATAAGAAGVTTHAMPMGNGRALKHDDVRGLVKDVPAISALPSVSALPSASIPPVISALPSASAAPKTPSTSTAPSVSSAQHSAGSPNTSSSSDALAFNSSPLTNISNQTVATAESIKAAQVGNTSSETPTVRGWPFALSFESPMFEQNAYFRQMARALALNGKEHSD